MISTCLIRRVLTALGIWSAVVFLSSGCGDAAQDTRAVLLRGATSHGGLYTLTNSALWRIDVDLIQAAPTNAYCLSDTETVAELGPFDGGAHDISGSPGFVLAHLASEQAVQCSRISLEFGNAPGGESGDSSEPAFLRITGLAVKKGRSIRFDLRVPTLLAMVAGPLDVLEADPAKLDGAAVNLVVEMQIRDCLIWLDFDDLPTDEDGVAYLPYSYWQSEFARNRLSSPDSYLAYWSD
jgi:hypothetical protein